MSMRSKLAWFYNDKIRRWKSVSYSQEGEDLILSEIFKHKRNGHYVDIGAHHPRRFSNTYKLYKRGWSGTCADPLPGFYKRFKKIRRRELVIEKAVVADSCETAWLYTLGDPALSTLKPDVIVEGTPCRKVEAINVNDLLDMHVKQFGDKIHLLNIDVEGMDIEILKACDLNKFSPFVIVIEAKKLQDESEIQCWLGERYDEYELVAKTMRNLILRRKW